MKKLFSILAFSTLCMMFTSTQAQTTDTLKEAFGIWQSHSDALDKDKYPEIHGRLFSIAWQVIETAPNVWDWRYFDSCLEARSQDDLPVVLMIFTKEDAPQWLYSNGVPKVMETDNMGNTVGWSPYYMDADYKLFFKRMISTVHQHVESLPDTMRNKIISVEACLGSTGDYISYKGNVEPQYQISGPQFFDLYKEFTLYYYNEYLNTNPKINIGSNPKNDGADQAIWFRDNCPGGWIKTGSIGKGYQLNDEISKKEWLYPLLNEPQFNTSDPYMRSRSEITGGAVFSNMWLDGKYRNMFALMTYMLHWGVDMSNQGYDQILDANYDSSFSFYDKYAGEKYAPKSAHAMCALRDGLDAADVVRFPESVYGPATRTVERLTSVVAPFMAYGAKLNDPESAISTNEMVQLNSNGINDAGWNVFAGNYDRFMHQITPNETSVGYWNVLSADYNSMYGRFARGFDNAKGKNALYFDLDSNFLNYEPLAAKTAVLIKVVYLDRGTGSWQLFYDALNDANKASISVTCTGTNIWKTASITIEDAYFGNRGLKGADFYIKSMSSENVLFSLIELERPDQNASNTGLFVTNTLSFDSTCINSTVDSKPIILGGSFLNGSPVKVGPLNGFLFLDTINNVYADSLIFNDYGATLNIVVNVKVNTANAGTFEGLIPVTGGGVSQKNILAKAIVVNSSPIITENLVNVTCFNAKNGNIDITATGGFGTIAYNWYVGGKVKYTTPDINTLTPGDYTLEVLSAAACKISKTYTITQPDPISVSVTGDDMICKNTTTTVYVNVTGGTAPYTNAGTISNVSTGWASYKVTDANGCTGSAPYTVTNGTGVAPVKPAAISGADADAKGLCGGGIFNYTIAPVSNATSYTWTVPAGCAIVSTSNGGTQLTMSAPANFNSGALAVSANNNCGSSVTQTKNLISIPANPGAINGYKVVAQNQTGLVYSVTPVSGMQYTWTVPGSAKINGSSVGSSVTINWGSANGRIKVAASTSCGQSGFSVLDITVSSGTSLYASVAALPTFDPICVNSSNVKSFVISGMNLNGSAISLAPVSGYSFSTSATGTFTNSLSLTNYGSSISQTIYVKFLPVAAAAYNGNIAVSGGGASSFNVALSGTGVSSSPALSAVISDVSCFGLQDGSVALTATGGAAPFIYSWTGANNFTSTTKDISGLVTGNYTVAVTSLGGCSTTKSIVINQPAALNMTATASEISCNGASTNVLVAATGGSIPYTGTGNFTAFAGTNDYIVTDKNGCTANKTLVITQPQPFVVTTSQNNITCNGGTATINVTAAGGTLPYTGTGTFTVPAGTYNYTVTDARGCNDTKSVTVSQPYKLTMSIAAGNVGTNGLASVTVTAMGGTSPYTGTGVFNVAPGTHAYVVTDANGCSATGSVTINPLSDLTAQANAGTIMCKNGTTYIVVTAAGGLAPYTGVGTYTVTAGQYNYKVTDAIGNVAFANVTVNQPEELVAAANANAILCYNGSTTINVSATGGTAPYLNTGLFTVKAGTYSYNITDANGCKDTASVVVNQPQVLSSTVTAGTIICNGSTANVTVSATGGTLPYTGTGTFAETAGAHIYTVTDANGCTSVKNLTLVQPSVLNTNVKASAIVCAGGSSTVTVTAYGGVAPYIGTGTFNVTAGTYTYTVTDAYGCAVPKTIVLEEGTLTTPAKPGIINGLNADTLGVCGTATFVYNIDTVPNAAIYSWYTPTGTSISSTSADGTTMRLIVNGNFVADSIYVTANNVCGISERTGKFITATPAQPSAINGLTSVNPLKVNVSYSVNGRTSLNYFWTVPQDATIVSGQNTDAIKVNWGINPGTITVRAFNGCDTSAPNSLYVGVATGSLSTSVNALPAFDTICVNSISDAKSFTLTGSALNGFDVVIGAVSGYAFSTTNYGTYTDSLIISGYGTSINKSIFVKFNPNGAGNYNGVIPVYGGGANTASVNLLAAAVQSSPALSAQITNITCNGLKNGAIDLTTTGGVGPFGYSWNGTGSFDKAKQDISGLSAVNYTVTVTAYGGCTSSATYTVNQPAALAVSVSADAMICKNTTANVYVSAAGGTLPYAGTGTFTAASGSSPYTVTDANGCAVTKSITVANGAGVAPAKPVSINSTSDAKGLCGGGSFTYTIDPVATATSYSWAIPANTSISSKSADGTQIVLSVPANFNTGTLNVTANNSCGISAAQTKSLTVIPAKPAVINGSTSAKAQQTGMVYSTSGIAGLTYTWTVPAGATITAGQNTPTITVKWGNNAGNVNVKAVSNCGSSSNTSLYVGILPSFSGQNGLEASSTSKVSNPLIMPNPVKDIAYMVFTADTSMQYNIIISSLTGKVLQQLQGVTVQGENRIKIDARNYANGMYMVTMIGADGTRTNMKLIKE
jgi:hypothetical protein